MTEAIYLHACTMSLILFSIKHIANLFKMAHFSKIIKRPISLLSVWYCISSSVTVTNALTQFIGIFTVDTTHVQPVLLLLTDTTK